MPANFGSLYFPQQVYIPLLYRGTGDGSTSSGSNAGGSTGASTPSNPGSGGGGSGQSENIGTTDTGVSFPIAGEAPAFPVIGFSPIPDITVPFVDPLETTKEVGDFNITQFNNALQLGIKNAKDLTQIDFDTLAQYYPQASNLQAEGVRRENALNRAEIGPSNFFNLNEVQKANRANQRERLTQLEDALPGARKTILEEIRRSAGEAGGSLISDIDNRAFESAAANAAGEQNVIRGFGDDSVFGRRVSDTLSAQQRLQLREAGTNNLNRFLSLGANLAFDQPIKYNPILDQPMTVRTSQDIRGTPSVSGAQLASSQQSAIASLSTINPAQAIQFEIGQNQFQAGFDRQADMFNSTGEFEAAKFNATGVFQSALEGFYADVFNAQQESNAINAGNAAEDAKDAFGSSSTIGTITSGVAALGSLVSGISGFFRGSGATSTASGAAATGGLIDGALSTVAASGATGVVGGATTFATEAAAQTAGYQVVGSATGGGVIATPGPAASLVSTGSAGSAGGALTFASEGAAQQAGYTAIGTAADGGVIATPTAGLLSAGSPLLTASGVLAGAYTGYQQISGIQSALQNKPLSIQEQAALALPTFGASLVYNPIKEFFDSGKDSRQQARDGFREYGAEIGLFKKPTEEQQEQLGMEGNSYYAQLADGSFYNVGTDGGAKLPNYGVNLDGKNERMTYDVDWSDPRAAESVSLLNPLGLMAFGDEYQQMMGHLWNAAASNTDSLSGMKLNMQKFAADAGIDYQTGVKLLNQYKDKGEVNGQPFSDQDYAIFMNSWNELMLQTGVPYDIKV